MVKGVNKTVIEVNDTGSRMFEKIVFYVTPQYGNIDPKRLQRAAGEFSFKFSEAGTYTPLRNRYRRQRRKKVLLALGFIGLAGLIVLLSLLL